MDSPKKSSFWILWGAAILVLLGVTSLVIKPKKATDASEKLESALTAAELNEFKEVVLDELDPDQRMVTMVEQWRETRIVDVTVGDDFMRTNQTQQGEIAIAMRDGLSELCECIPYLRFNTEDGQLIVAIGRNQPDFK